MKPAEADNHILFLLKTSAHLIAETLAQTFHLTIICGTIPKIWKSANMFPLHGRGGGGGGSHWSEQLSLHLKTILFIWDLWIPDYLPINDLSINIHFICQDVRI